MVPGLKSPDQLACGLEAERPEGERWIDARAGWEDGARKDIQPGRIMHLESAVDDARGWIVVHTAAADVVRTSGPGESRPMPGLRRSHGAQNRLTLIRHEVRQPVLIRMQVVGHPDYGHAESAAVPMIRIDIEVVAAVGKCLRLHADDAPVLPTAQVLLVSLTPPRDIWRQGFAADLDRQELVLCTECRTTQETMRSTIERRVEKIVDHNGLRRGSGMTIEDRFREVAVDMREHLTHEVLAKLPGGVP